MIRDFEFFHGAAIARIVHSARPVSLSPYPSHGNASYVVNGKIGLYIKYSSNRMTPWHFNFKKEHQDEILQMKMHLGSVVVALVCNDDGIVGLTFEELKSLLDESHDEVEWISASRRPRQQYSVKGKDGELRYKVTEGEFLEKLLLQSDVPAASKG